MSITNWCYAIATLALLATAGGCKSGLQSSPPDMALPALCVDLPEDPGATPQPSLQNMGEVPRILWQKSYQGTDVMGLSGMLVLTGDRLAFASGYGLWILDHDGNVLANPVEGPAWGAPSAGVVADEDGNFYFSVAQAVSSFDSDGKERWRFDLGDNKSPEDEYTRASRLLLSPAGNLYFAATDGVYYAIRSDSQSILWRHQIQPTPYINSYASVGAGDYVFANLTYAARTGEVSGIPPVVDGVPTKGIPEFFGFYTVNFDTSGEKVSIQGNIFDRCGKRLWAFPNTEGTFWYPSLVGYDEQILISGFGEPDGVGYVYDKSGKRLKGPVPMPSETPQVLGADNVFYSYSCNPTDQNLTLIAYSWNSLQKQWSLDLGRGCTLGGAVLADNGTLYLARTAGAGEPVEVIAVQTASPGLAHTSEPTWLYNNRRTGWLE